MVNVHLYGAVGDGVTDDTRAIRAAVEAAQKANDDVYFPFGTYKISDPDVKPGSGIIDVPPGVSFLGEGGLPIKFNPS